MYSQHQTMSRAAPAATLARAAPAETLARAAPTATLARSAPTVALHRRGSSAAPSVAPRSVAAHSVPPTLPHTPGPSPQHITHAPTPTACDGGCPVPTPPYEPVPTPPAVPAPTPGFGDDAFSANSTLNDTVGVFKRTYFSTDPFRDAKFVETFFGLTVRAAQNWKMPADPMDVQAQRASDDTPYADGPEPPRGANGTIPCARRAVLAGADGFELHFFESFVTPEGATRAGDWVDSWSALHAALGDDDYDWDVFAPPTVTFYAKEIMPFVQRLDHHAVPFRAFQYLRPGTDRRMHSALVNVPFTGLTLEVTSEQSLARNESARFRPLAPRECPPSLWLRSEPAALDAQLDALGAAGRNALGLPGVVVAALATPARDDTVTGARDYFSKVLGVDLGTTDDDKLHIADDKLSPAGDDGSADDGGASDVAGARVALNASADATGADRGGGGGGGGDDDDDDYACEVDAVLVSKKFKVRGEVEAAQIYLRSINNKAASQGRGAYTLKELEAYVKSTHKEYMGFGRGWDRYIDNHLGITASGASLDRVADTLYNDGVPYHFHPDCEDCEGGSIWGAAPGALAMELQGDVDSSSDMRKMSLIDYCSPNSNGDMDRDSMDDQLDEVAYSFEYGVKEAGFPVPPPDKGSHR